MCRFKNRFCNTCNNVGHLARVCIAKDRVEHVNQIEDNNDSPEVDHTTHDENKIHVSGSDKFTIDVKLEGKPFQMKLDTRAALPCISSQEYKQLNLGKVIFHTRVQLRTYTGKIIKQK